MQVEIIRNFHIKIECRFIDQAFLIISNGSIELCLANKTEPVNFHLTAQFFFYFAFYCLFGSFSKLDAPAHRIVIIIAVIIDHKDFIIFDDDCPNTDIGNTFTAADAYIFVHVFPMPLPAAGDGSVGALMYILSSL